MPVNLPKPENPLKIYIDGLLLLLSLLLMVMIFQSCKSVPLQNTHTIEKIIEYKKDSTKIVNTNGAILDSLFIAVGDIKKNTPCDSFTNAEINNLLKKINSHKTSGNNAAGIYYDELKKMIVSYQKIAETRNEKTEVKADTKKNYIEVKTVEKQVKYIPWWIKALAVVGAIYIAFVVYRISRIWF
jgi:hypothetical protein